MTPLFTIHAGEYLVGSYIEDHFKNLNVWIPSKDTGIDLLVTDRNNRHTASLQVKFGKDFLPTHHGPEFQEPLRVCSWFTIKSSKLRMSKADLWIFVLRGFKKHSPDFVIAPTAEYKERLRHIHGLKGKRIIQSYLWVTEQDRCWETRELEDGKNDELRIAAGVYENPVREFTKYLNESGWSVLEKKLK